MLQVITCKWAYFSTVSEVNIQFVGIALKVMEAIDGAWLIILLSMPEYTHNQR